MEANKAMQLRKALLYIANEVKRICDKHQIKYFITAGSLLGAVRHKGFIPWDDDFDIGFTKENYEKFLLVASSELQEDFYVENDISNPNCPNVFSKIRLKGTKYVEAKGNHSDDNSEIFIDLFPYFYVSNSSIKRWYEGLLIGIISQAIIIKAGGKPWIGDGKIKRYKFLPVKVIAKSLSMKIMRRMVNWYFNKYKNTEYYCILDGKRKSYQYETIEADCLNEYMDAKFEDCVFPIPKKYDRILRRYYGDYMIIPDKENQETHNVEILDFGKYRFR